jgi:Protein of unknown function (DUF2934)
MTANQPTPSLDKGSLELTEDYIRLRAYELFEQRGGEHGHDLEDWIRAEAEILGAIETAALYQERTRKRARAA